MVPSEYVVWMGDPETSRSLICVKQTPGSLSQYSKIVLQIVLSLSCIFNEERMAHGLIGHIIGHSQIVHSVNGACSVISMVNGIAPHVRFVDGSYHMEMNWVSAKLECLAHISQFDVFNSANDRFISLGMKHYVGTE